MSRTTLAVAFGLSLGLSLLGCDHRPEDFSRVEGAASSFQSSWLRRVGEVKARHAQLLARAQSVPAGTEGVDAALSRLSGMTAELTELGERVESIHGQVAAKVTERRRKLAEEALSRGERELRDDLDALTRTLDEVGAQLDQIAGQAAAAATTTTTTPGATGEPPTTTVVTTGTPTPAAEPNIADPEFARRGGTAQVGGVAFKTGTAQLDKAAPTTAQTLADLVAFANRCDALRFQITGHTAKDGKAETNQRLSEARAHTIRKHLIASGVAPAKIETVMGVGGNKPLVKEPEPGSPEEKAMPVEELAEIRARNRRISITVNTPCP